MTSTSNQRRRGRAALPGLGLILLAAGCADVPGTAWMPLGGNRNMVAADSLTVQRVRGTSPDFAPILPEAGNVWPEPEPDRPTLLGGPDEAMRNIPEFRPSLVEPLPGGRPVAGMPGRRGSGGLGEGLPPPADPPRVAGPPPAPVFPPPSRSGGVTLDPSGRPAVTTGQAGNVRGFTQPGVGGGAVIRDGNVETWIGPDGQARTRVVPP